MNIAIIGTGNVGGALATQWHKKGHQVMIGSKFPLSEKSLKLASVIGEDKFTSIAHAVQQSEVILIATPPQAIVDISEQWGDVSNKVIIDATNSIAKGPASYETVFHYLSATTDAALVKCFNTTGFENMLNPVYQGEGIDMFMAGDNAIAKDVAVQLALDCGFENCYDFGKADKVVLLEKFALAWINLAIMQGQGRDIAFRLVRR